MLQRSFIHLPGIGPTTERKLWERGIQSWAQLHYEASHVFKEAKAGVVRDAIERSDRAYGSRDFSFFSSALPRDQLWRLIPEVSLDDVAFLDIETTGLGFPPAAHSTTITFYYQGRVLQEHDRQAKLELIRAVTADCSLLVTFFGQAFDVPFLTHEYGHRFEMPHLDLCFWLKRLGYRGGLKKVQKRFASIPLRTSMDIDGYDAVRLWRLHERGVSGALETLLAYNAEDTVVLEPLLVEAFNLEVAKNAEHGLQPLASRPWPALPTEVRPEIYELLRGLG
jgi:uncharacterized protein